MSPGYMPAAASGQHTTSPSFSGGISPASSASMSPIMSPVRSHPERQTQHATLVVFVWAAGVPTLSSGGGAQGYSSDQGGMSPMSSPGYSDGGGGGGGGDADGGVYSEEEEPIGGQF